MPKTKYKRILLKLSGEALAGHRGFGVDWPVLESVAREIGRVTRAGVEVAVVVGGGNFWRGSTIKTEQMDRATADYTGMLATIVNALALQSVLEKRNISTRVQSAIEVHAVAEPYIRRRAIRHLEKERVVIFAGGTGNPYMTTDTAAALRAIEISADILLVAKNKVDGVYDSDPAKNPKARKFDKLSHDQALALKLKVMDVTAFSLCRENKLPVLVFDLGAPGSIQRAVAGEPIGTFITPE